jgi:hypothetical protein
MIRLLERFLAHQVDIRYRPGVGTAYAWIDRETCRRVVEVHLVDAARPDERLRVPPHLVRELDGCWSPADIRALLAGA